MLAVKFDKNRQFDAPVSEWDDFASGLRYKRIIQFHASDFGDTKRLDTEMEIWLLRYGGVLYSFDFGRINDERLRTIVKWLTVKFLNSYSMQVSNDCFTLFALRDWTLEGLELPKLYEMMDLSLSSKSDFRTNDFYIIKRVTEFLISNEAPGTDIEDLFELEQYIPNTRGNVLGYYDMDVRLTPLEEEFIRTQSTHDMQFVERLSYTELRDFIVLKICYEIGLRPIQLFRLSISDFRIVARQYFSIERPLAKKGKLNEHIKGTDNLSISPELGGAIQTLISRQVGHSTQLLQEEDGSVFSKRRGVKSINRTLNRWGAEEAYKTPYDFRHNMAHRMVMAGSSATEIAYILGHNSLSSAMHYIAASPSISHLREKALARNNTYGTIVALLTGDLALPEDWQNKEVFGRVGNELATGIGGCDATDCEYVPVLNCYGCQDFHPFEDGRHNEVLEALRFDASKIIAISDSTRQSGMNPAMTQLEGTMEQVKAVISRCKTCLGGQNAE